MPSTTPMVRDDFEDDSSLCSYLARQLVRGRLAIVLGAGISVPFGLPGWQRLIERMFEEKGTSVPTGNYSLESLAEHFRRQYYPSDAPGFIGAIHRSLYRGVSSDFSLLRANATLASVGALVMGSRRGSASEVITFNFDNLLEVYLRYYGFVTTSAFCERHWAGYADVTVYHPHGMIPVESDAQRSSDVVFDQHSYSAVVGKEGNLWRQLALTIMRRRTCLFIGLSGRDINLDSMLASTKDEHASGAENTAYWGVTFTTDTDAVTAGQWEARGVFTKVVGDYDRALPEFLFRICQDAASIRENE